jgi:hypothetical protein
MQIQFISAVQTAGTGASRKLPITHNACHESRFLPPGNRCGLAFPSGRLGSAGISRLASRHAATYSDADWSDTVTLSACSEVITQIRLVRK